MKRDGAVRAKLDVIVLDVSDKCRPDVNERRGLIFVSRDTTRRVISATTFWRRSLVNSIGFVLRSVIVEASALAICCVATLYCIGPQGHRAILAAKKR